MNTAEDDNPDESTHESTPELTPPSALEPSPHAALALVGAAVVVGERLRGVGALSRRVVGVSFLPMRWVLESPTAQPLVRFTSDQVDRLAARGRTELTTRTERGLDVARESATRLTQTTLLPEVLDDVATPLLGPVLDAALPVAFQRLEQDPSQLVAVVDALLTSVLDAALPLVFQRLQEDPEQLVGVVDALLDPLLPKVMGKLGEQPDMLVDALGPVIDGMLEQMMPVVPRLGDQSDGIRTLIVEQSGSLATDLADEMRSRVVTGDDLIERVLKRTHLRRRPASPTTAVEPVTGVPTSDDGIAP